MCLVYIFVSFLYFVILRCLYYIIYFCLLSLYPMHEALLVAACMRSPMSFNLIWCLNIMLMNMWLVWMLRIRAAGFVVRYVVPCVAYSHFVLALFYVLTMLFFRQHPAAATRYSMGLTLLHPSLFDVRNLPSLLASIFFSQAASYMWIT